MFTYKTKIRMYDTDAAGIIFFANQFRLIHDAYEELLLKKFGFSIQSILKEKKYFQPIVHAESDYKAPLSVGDKITITIKVGHIGNSSFSLEYTLKRGKMLVGTAKTVHVAVSPKTHKKIPLPSALRRALDRESLN
jgi:1,4-dihydroxy-2-naphthoyl-CoA hydrolase